MPPPNNREPTPTERDACIGYLRSNRNTEAMFILCVGRTAAHSLLEVNDAISRLRAARLL